NVIDDNNQNPQFDPWGTTITDTSITKLDLSKVTKNLAIRVLANQKAEIVRSGLSSKNKIIVDLNRVTEIIGTSVGSKTTELDLSAINTDSEITLIGRGKVSVVIPGFNLLTHTTGQNLSF
ncbi:MAG: hypothetical protein HKP08_02500, partial [Flavobacteriaceae bacterium]|nr:hypothetical protein [Flavobacteriaceae bacterium]